MHSVDFFSNYYTLTYYIYCHVLFVVTCHLLSRVILYCHVSFIVYILRVTCHLLLFYMTLSQLDLLSDCTSSQLSTFNYINYDESKMANL